MIKRVLFDIDDTILDFKACEKQALSRALDAFSLPYQLEDLADYSRINDGMWKCFERGEIDRETLKIKRFEVFLSRYPVTPLATDFAERYMSELSKTSVLIDGAIDTLSVLFEKYDLFILTNGYERTQKGRIEASGIGKYFKDVFISERIGVAKPQKGFFDYCAAHIPHFSLSDSVLVGDSSTSDVLGGKAYGLFTIRYNPREEDNPPEAIPDREIRSLRELPSLLEKL